MIMETNALQSRIISKVKAMSPDQLAWLESVLSRPFEAGNDIESDFINEIMILQDNGGAFDFLENEPDHYTIADCKSIYDPKSEQFVPNDLFKPGNP
jgi:hypothetical protein